MNWTQNDTGMICYTCYNTSYGGEFEYWYVSRLDRFLEEEYGE